MYKVFFNERTAYLTEQLPNQQEQPGDLYYRFEGGHELKAVVTRFADHEEYGNLYLVSENLTMLKKAFRKCFRVIKAGGGIIFNTRGEFLAIRRRGKWDLPKGKFEKKEDFESAALREAGEETGLRDLSIVQPLITTWHTYRLGEERILKKTRWFEMHYTGSVEPVPQMAEGITGYRWVQPGSADFMLQDTYGSIADVLRIKGIH